jgi:hypothetical protein
MKRKAKRFCLRTRNNELAVLRAAPWIYVESPDGKPPTCVWLVCLAVSKSRRQINDWLNCKKNRRSRALSKQMTGKSGAQPLYWAFYKLKEIEDYIPDWDGLWFWFDAVEKDKQRRVYIKGFSKYGNPNWQYLPAKDAFYFFKHPVLK